MTTLPDVTFNGNPIISYECTVLVQAYRNYRRVNEEFKLEQIRCDKAAGALRDRVTELKTMIKEESKLQFLYEVCVA